MVYVPLSTGFVTLFGINPSTGRAVKNILVMPKDADEVSRAQFQIMNVLRLRHKIVQPAPDDFSVRTQSDLLDMVQSVNKVFTSLLAATAAISLLVGGIGIMNIMLVSVSEKTREIGIRKAVGAKFRDIMLQFMTESILLSSAGGLLGIACGVIGANLITLIVKWATIVTLSSVLTSFLVATMIGLFFGIYPAKRASQLDPIVALRAD
jgi:putative ABC transport system permease protein